MMAAKKNEQTPQRLTVKTERKKRGEAAWKSDRLAVLDGLMASAGEFLVGEGEDERTIRGFFVTAEDLTVEDDEGNPRTVAEASIPMAVREWRLARGHAVKCRTKFGGHFVEIL